MVWVTYDALYICPEAGGPALPVPVLFQCQKGGGGSSEVCSLGCSWLECGHCFGLSGLIIVPGKNRT